METQQITRPKVLKKVTVTPNDWMKIYEKRKGELVFDGTPQLRPGQNIVFIPVNTETKRELKGLPKLVRSVVEINEIELGSFEVRIGDEQ